MEKKSHARYYQNLLHRCMVFKPKHSELWTDPIASFIIVDFLFWFFKVWFLVLSFVLTLFFLSFLGFEDPT